MDAMGGEMSDVCKSGKNKTYSKVLCKMIVKWMLGTE